MTTQFLDEEDFKLINHKQNIIVLGFIYFSIGAGPLLLSELFDIDFDHFINKFAAFNFFFFSPFINLFINSIYYVKNNKLQVFTSTLTKQYALLPITPLIAFLILFVTDINELKPSDYYEISLVSIIFLVIIFTLNFLVLNFVRLKSLKKPVLKSSLLYLLLLILGCFTFYLVFKYFVT